MRVFLITLLLATVPGCAENIGRSELLSQIHSGSPPLVVDVRSRGEYETSHVPGAVHIPFYRLVSSLKSLPETPGENDEIVVYCEHGPRAGIARAQLWFATEQPVLFLDGHMAAWKKDGLEVESEVGAAEARD